MSRKSKALVLLSVTAGVLVAVGVTLLMQSRSRIAKVATGTVWQQYEPLGMEMTKDTNGVWWYRVATITQHTAEKSPP